MVCRHRNTPRSIRCQSFWPVVWIGSPTPSTVSECVPTGSKGGGHTRLRGRGCLGSQFRRRDRHPGTLYTNPFSLEHSPLLPATEGNHTGVFSKSQTLRPFELNFPFNSSLQFTLFKLNWEASESRPGHLHYWTFENHQLRTDREVKIFLTIKEYLVRWSL